MTARYTLCFHWCFGLAFINIFLQFSPLSFKISSHRMRCGDALRRHAVPHAQHRNVSVVKEPLLQHLPLVFIQ